jgi:hypothetical protein
MMPETVDLDEDQQAALSAVKAVPGRTAAEIAPLIRRGQGRGASRTRALAVLGQLEDMQLVTRETGQRRVSWHPAE